MQFTTKKAKKEYIKGILNSYGIHEEVSQEHFDFLLSLLDFHPRAEEKIGSGVVTITVEANDRNTKYKQFVLHRTDGSHTEFSYIKCVDGEVPFSRLFAAACRTAIDPQIQEFRALHTAQENNGTHVDHHITSFKRIVDDFYHNNPIPPDNVVILGFGDNETSKYFADKELEKRFADYHRSRATLKLIPAQENLRKKRD